MLINIDLDSIVSALTIEGCSTSEAPIDFDCGRRPVRGQRRPWAGGPGRGGPRALARARGTILEMAERTAPSEYQAVVPDAAAEDAAEAAAIDATTKLPADEASTPFGWWVAQVSFFASGFFVTLNQYESDWGANASRSMLNGLSQYGGMAFFAWLLIHGLGRRRRNTPWWPLPLLRDPRARLAAASMALPDLAAVPLQVYGLNHTGSGIFIVVFATVTAWVAALRYGMLRKGLRVSQILGVLMIVGGQALVVRDGTAGSEASTLAFVSGVIAILAAAFLDAVMYVFTERAAAQRSPTAGGGSERLITEDESCCLVGVVNLGFAALYVAAYAAAGRWGAWVARPIADAGASPGAVAAVWLADAFLYYAHYGSFYYCAKYSSVSAGVNKALQSAAIFYSSDLIFCSRARRAQCLTLYKVLASAAVCVGVLVYGLPPRANDLLRPSASAPPDGDAGLLQSDDAGRDSAGLA